MAQTIVVPDGALDDPALTAGQFRLLCQIATVASGLTVSQLATRNGRGRSAVYATVQKLEELRYIERNGALVLCLERGA